MFQIIDTILVLHKIQMWNWRTFAEFSFVFCIYKMMKAGGRMRGLRTRSLVIISILIVTVIDGIDQFCERAMHQLMHTCRHIFYEKSNWFPTDISYKSALVTTSFNWVSSSLKSVISRLKMLSITLVSLFVVFCGATDYPTSIDPSREAIYSTVVNWILSNSGISHVRESWGDVAQRLFLTIENP